MLMETKKTSLYGQTQEIIELVNTFEKCTLPVANWTHQRYLMVAFWYLYLNSLGEANQLLSNSLQRFRFENNLPLLQNEGFERSKQTRFLRAMDNFIKIYKSEKSFVELANLILEQFGDANYCAEIKDLKIDFPQIEVRRIVDLRQIARARN
jgi:hypothetical protein